MVNYIGPIDPKANIVGVTLGDNLLDNKGAFESVGGILVDNLAVSVLRFTRFLKGPQDIVRPPYQTGTIGDRKEKEFTGNRYHILTEKDGLVFLDDNPYSPTRALVDTMMACGLAFLSCKPNAEAISLGIALAEGVLLSVVDSPLVAVTSSSQIPRVLVSSVKCSSCAF